VTNIVLAPFRFIAGIFAVKLPTQRLGELSQQTAKEGEPIPIIWGTAPPIAGNLVAVQEPPRIERRKQRSGGKGPSGSSQKIEVPRRTYAMGICEGPNVTLRRAWRNAKLVYDGRSGSDWGAKNNGTFLQRFRFYPGSFTQLPDADLEAVFGVGNVPAMRGLAYMVALDEDLQDTGGAVPQWQFEVVRAEGLYLTSWTYPVEAIEGISSAADADRGLFWLAPSDQVESSATAVAMSNTTILRRYQNGEPDNAESQADAVGATLVFINPADPPIAQNADTESLDSSAFAVSMTLTIGLIRYEIPTESIDSSADAVSGSFT